MIPDGMIQIQALYFGQNSFSVTAQVILKLDN